MLSTRNLVQSLIPLFALLQHTLAQEVDSNLRFFAPLLNKTWIGRFENPPRESPVLIDRYVSTVHGKAVKKVREVKELDFYREALFYWDPVEKHIQYVNLTKNGFAGRGIATLENSKLVMEGTQVNRDNTVSKVRNTLEMTRSGGIIDKFYVLVNEVWELRHEQTYTAKEK